MMKQAISITEAVTQLWAIALANRIPGEVPQTTRELDAKALPSQWLGHGFYLRWERGWAVDAKLEVSSTVQDGRLILTVAVGWCSSTFAAHSARAATALHAQVADIACWMQAAIDSLPPLKVDKEGR